MIGQDQAFLRGCIRSADSSVYKAEYWLLTLSSDTSKIHWTQWRDPNPTTRLYFTSNFYPGTSEVIGIGGVAETYSRVLSGCFRVLVQPRSLVEGSLQIILQNYDRIKPALSEIPANLQELVDVRHVNAPMPD